jgi:hypothetical protein
MLVVCMFLAKVRLHIAAQLTSRDACMDVLLDSSLVLLQLRSLHAQSWRSALQICVGTLAEC